MAAKIIDGKAVAEEIVATVKAGAATLKAEKGVTPGIAVVIVGEDPASQVYVRSKGRKAEECGFHSVTNRLEEKTTQDQLLALLDTLNADPAIHGILVQLPLPAHIDEGRVIQSISPDKDVDGFHYVNVGRLVTGNLDEAFVPCTPAGSMVLIRRALGRDDLSGLNAVVIGRSNIVGKPMASLLLAANATVTVVHSRTRDLTTMCSAADIVVAAVGKPRMVRVNCLKPGACVIDVGINRVPDPRKGEGATKLVGDVDYDECSLVAGSITPVPGGVGPMTIAMLMANTLTAACWAAGVKPPRF
jgi:methylenetetrahydrofolate dehydrogenase (NADP+)/methenyltetrahydrofolate cyclohydrolase